MNYKNVVKAVFIRRVNRFVAEVELNGAKETVHVKNTGRCQELLIPGSTVYLAASDQPARKTKYDLIVVEKTCSDSSTMMVNIDSQAPNQAAEEWLRKGALFPSGALIRREVRYQNSRFDFFIQSGDARIFLEVKGVTLEQNGTALFPDAPTERGVKHLHELTSCLNEGYGACVLFVVQMKGASVLRPNDDTHPAFGAALRRAAEAGVRLLAVDCIVTKDRMELNDKIEILL